MYPSKLQMHNLSKTENETLMPIGGNSLPIDVAPVRIELSQVQVDHAIAKMTKQQEEEGAAECVVSKENENPIENTPRPAPAVVAENIYNISVSLRLRVQNAVPAQPCVGKLGISLVLLNFLHCNFRLWFKTP